MMRSLDDPAPPNFTVPAVHHAFAMLLVHQLHTDNLSLSFPLEASTQYENVAKKNELLLLYKLGDAVCYSTCGRTKAA